MGQLGGAILFKGHLFLKPLRKEEEDCITEYLCDATGDATFSVLII